MKRTVAFVLSLVLALSLCACGGKDKGSAGKYDESGKVSISIGMPSHAKIISMEENALTKWLKDQTGYNIEIVEYSGGTDIATQISTTIAARQELPDILWGVNIGTTTVSTYGKEGYFADLKPYFDDKEGASKTFWSRMDEGLSQYQKDYVVRKMTDPDTGGIYGVPVVETSLVDGLDFMVWINTEWLDKLGLSKPTNTDELYDVLVAFRDKDPNGNGKKDEIPLFGSMKSSGPCQAINWLVNMFLYYNDSHLWQDYNGDGQLESAYVQDAYREALRYVNKLYKEGLLTNMIYTVSGSEMKSITTPSSGTALCGIFCGHLTSHTTYGNEVLYQYECLKTWGSVTEADISYILDTFITETAIKRDVVDECFNLLMTLWSKDGSMRMRYGEYGVNWVDADADAVSDYGLKAEYKLLDDPFMQQNAVMWGDISCTLLLNAEGETAQITDQLDKWTATRCRMLASARQYYNEVQAEINPKFLADPFLESFVLNSTEDESISMQRTNVNSYIASSVRDFVCGTNNMNINNDRDWKTFIDKLNELGYEDIRTMYQTCYERQKAQ